MCVYIYIYIYICICIYNIHVFMCVHIHIYIYIYIYRYTSIYIYIYIDIAIHICFVCLSVWLFICLFVCLRLAFPAATLPLIRFECMPDRVLAEDSGRCIESLACHRHHEQTRGARRNPLEKGGLKSSSGDLWRRPLEGRPV